MSDELLTTFAAIDRSQLLTAVGRLHPVLVHFPIALLIVAALVEAWGLLRRRPMSGFARTGTLFALVFAAMAVGTGLANAASETDAGSAASASAAVETHRNVGLVALGLAIAVGLHSAFVPTKRLMAFRLGLFAAAAAVGLAGHLGGSLVYGPTYLTGPWKALLGVTPPRPPSRPQLSQPPQRLPGGPLAGPTDVPPIEVVAVTNDGRAAAAEALAVIEHRCWECHGPDKRKGRLRLDSEAALRAGGKHGPVFSTTDPSTSEILRRIVSDNPDDVMPPEGEPLTTDQVGLLRRWIEGGAPWPGGAKGAAGPERGAAPGGGKGG